MSEIKFKNGKWNNNPNQKNFLKSGCLKFFLIFWGIIFTFSILQSLSKPENSNKEKSKLYIVSKTSYVACQQKESFDKLSRIASDGDLEAYKDLFYRYILSEECIQFKNDDAFYLVESGFSVVKVRPKGQTESYWTNREILY